MRIDSSEVIQVKQRKIRSILWAAGILVLILDSRTAIVAAQASIELCLQVVIPSLLPFFVLVSLLTSSIHQDTPSLRPIGKLCGMPRGSENLFIIGLLGGYPTGARAVTQAYKEGRITKEDAQRMLGFCNNAGPAFLFGMVAQQFRHRWTPWLIWIVLIIAAILTGILTNKPAKDGIFPKIHKPITLPIALKTSIQALALVCGWIILFRILVEYMDRWLFHLLPATLQIILVCCLELVNGCYMLSSIPNEGLRFILACGSLSLGGLCIAMQTASVIEELEIKHYLLGKAFQCGISLMLAFFIQLLFPPQMRLSLPPAVSVVFLSFLAILAIILRELEKRCSIPGKLVVY